MAQKGKYKRAYVNGKANHKYEAIGDSLFALFSLEHVIDDHTVAHIQTNKVMSYIASKMNIDAPLGFKKSDRLEQKLGLIYSIQGIESARLFFFEYLKIYYSIDDNIWYS